MNNIDAFFEEVYTLHYNQKYQLFELWNKEYPTKLAFQCIKDLDNYLNRLTNVTHYVILEKVKIIGWAFTFNRENERWFAIIIDNNYQKQGLGNQLLSILKEKETKLSGWVIDHNLDNKVNGETYKSPLEFYVKNNFEILSKEQLELDTISAVKIQWKK